MLHIAKGRAPITYTWPYPAIQAGFPWQAELRVWDAAEAPVDLRAYSFLARIVEPWSDHVLATAVVSTPATGVIRWTFADSALANTSADVYRFTLDAGLADGAAQRLVDARLPVREGAIVIGSAAPPVIPDVPVDPEEPPPPDPTTLPELFFTGAQTMNSPTQTMLGQLEPTPVGDFPNAGNTGLVAAITTTVTGNINVSADGQIVQNTRVNNGMILCHEHANVTIRNCEVNSQDYFGIDADNTTGVTIEDCKITGVGGLAGVLLTGGTLSRCNISGYSNGVLWSGGPTLIEDNYIHDLIFIGSDPHYDGIQTGTCHDTIIRHNTIISRDTSHIFMANDSGASTNVQIVNNQFLPDPGAGGPGNNIYVDGRKTSALMSNFEIAYNVGIAGQGGTIYVSTENTSSINVHDNVLTDSSGSAGPILNSMSPTAALVGAADFVLTVTGSNFTATSKIWFNGAQLATTMVSVTTLTATVSTAGLAAGNYTVQVKDGTATSAAALSFQLQAVGTTFVTFYNGATPAGIIANDTAELTIGARLHPLVLGKVKAIMWYRPHVNAATDGKVGLWDFDGTLLQVVPFVGKNTIGWQRVPITYSGSLSISAAYLIGVWLKLGSDGKAWFQAQGGKFTSAGIDIPGVISMPISDDAIDRGNIRRNNYYKYFTGDIAVPLDSVGGSGYFVDCEYQPD